MRADSCFLRLTVPPRAPAIAGGALLALIVVTGLGAGPARAQSGMYGFVSSYNLYSGQRANGRAAPQRAPSGLSGGSTWRPGAGSVYPPAGAYTGPRPSVNVGAGYGGTGYASGGSTRVVGGTVAARGSYGTAPRGTITVTAMGAGRDVALPPAGVGAAPVDAYDEADYYDEDGPPLPVHRSASGGKGVDPKFDRRLVRYTSSDPVGTVIVDTGARYLYLIQGDGTALRYGIGVGKEGFAWSGTQRISNKREWPEWRPPAEMIARRPDLPRMMQGGPDNPLGARALYLGDTLYRIHGTNEPETIGQAVSSGCIRLRNEDVVDLYERVPVGALVRVI